MSDGRAGAEVAWEDWRDVHDYLSADGLSHQMGDVLGTGGDTSWASDVACRHFRKCPSGEWGLECRSPPDDTTVATMSAQHFLARLRVRSGCTMQSRFADH